MHRFKIYKACLEYFPSSSLSLPVVKDSLSLMCQYLCFAKVFYVSYLL